MLQLFVACASLCVADTTRLLLFVKPTTASYSCLPTLFGFMLVSTEGGRYCYSVKSVDCCFYLRVAGWCSLTARRFCVELGHSPCVPMGSLQVLPQLGARGIVCKLCLDVSVIGCCSPTTCLNCDRLPPR